MGFLDKFFSGGKSGQSGSSNQCPACGAMAMTIAGRVLCTNPSCKNFAANAVVSSSSTSGKPPAQGKGAFVPEKPLNIRYRNFRGEEKTFLADAATAVRKNNFLSVQVAPKGIRVALARNRVLNLDEVESAFPQQVAKNQDWPSAKERQVLNYHKKYGSTSPLYQKIRAKYPNW